jgi:uncharacterized protein YraI
MCKTLLQRVLLAALLVMLSAGQADPAAAGTDVWTSNGPEGGPINVLVINPTTPTILYAGTEGSGVFKSTNGGEIWTAFNTDLNYTHVRALAIDPTIPTFLYAGTEGGGVFTIRQMGEGIGFTCR